MESLNCREICSDVFPFAFAAQDMHNCMVDWLRLLSSFLVSLKGRAFPSSILKIKSHKDECRSPKKQVGLRWKECKMVSWVFRIKYYLNADILDTVSYIIFP